MAAGPDSEGVARARRMEKNTYPQGKVGAGSKVLPGTVGNIRQNPTQGGGVNRPTKSKSSS